MTSTARLSELDALRRRLQRGEQLAGFLVGADEALQPGQPAWSQVGIMLLRGVDRDTAC